MQSPRTSNARIFDLMEDAGLEVCGLPALAIDSTAESHPFLRPCSVQSPVLLERRLHGRDVPLAD